MSDAETSEQETGSPQPSRPATTSSRPRSSAAGSRAATATSQKGSRPATALSRSGSARSGAGSRAGTAQSISRSRPGSGRPDSGKSIAAWSDDVDPEAGPVQVEPDSDDDDDTHNQDTVGCWVKITNFVASLWSTTDMVANEEREVLVRTTLRELIVYLVFLVILCIVTLSAMTNNMYLYTDILRNKLLKEQNNINTVDQLFHFLENDFLDSIYVEKWYNKGDDPVNFPCPDNPGVKGPCPIDPRDRMVLDTSKLLGVPRLRQLRVRNDSCLIPEEVTALIDVCYDHYSSSEEDENRFGPGYRTYTNADAWRYQNTKELGGIDTNGYLATYSGAGSIQELRLQKNETKAILRELKEGLWISRATRYVSLDFTLYNANINLFCVTRLGFEFPPTGGIIPYARFETVKLLRYITAGDYAIMGVEIVFALFTLYYVIEELIEIKENKLDYFKTFWNVIDLFVITISAAVLAFNLYCFVRVATLLKGLLAEPETYADFTYLATWSKTWQDAAAMAVFFAWLKVFKYISFNKTMMQLSVTITKCYGDVGGFSVMFFIIFGAFAQIAYLIFGAQIEDFSSLKNACFTQFRLILGDFDFPAIESAHRILGPAWFLLYIFLVFFVLMNMFLAIINDTYSEVKAEIEARKEDFQVADFVMRGYNNVRGMVAQRDKMLDIRATIKLAADDGVVTYEEIRDALRKLNFSETEIELFCSKYDKDGDFMFDREEINNIEAGLEDMMENSKHLQIEAKPESRAASAVASRPQTAIPKFNKSEFVNLDDRVTSMEQSLGMVVTKINSVLEKLDKFDTKRDRKAFSASMRNIASARDRDDDQKRKEMEDLVKGELQKFDENA